MRHAVSRLGTLVLVVAGACAGPPPEEVRSVSIQPTRVTLRSPIGVGEAVRLSDAAVLPAGSGGDLTFGAAMVLSLRSSTPDSLCDKGTVAALDDVPADEAGCPAAPAGWRQIVYLGGTTVHALADSQAAGRGLLVRDRDHRARYRVRIVGDAYGPEAGATIVFDLARLP